MVLNGSPLQGRAIGCMVEKYCPDIAFLGQIFACPAAFEAPQGPAPDIILLDAAGQSASVLDTVKRIIETYPDVQLVVLTAGDDPAILKQLIFLGIHHYCRKPLDPQDFEGIINHLAATISVTSAMDTFEQHSPRMSSRNQPLMQAVHSGARDTVVHELALLRARIDDHPEYDSSHLRSTFMEIATGIATLDAPGQIGEILLAFYKAFLSDIMTTDSRERLWQLLDGFVTDATALFSKAYSTKKNLIIARIMQIVEDRHSDQITLEAIANEMFFSQSYLSRLFKQCAGKSFRDFLCDCRLEHAKVLLQMTERTIDSIAHEVGYENANSFRRLFKSKNGVSASEYRAQRSKS